MEEKLKGLNTGRGAAVEPKPENPPAFPRTAYDGRGETDSPYPHHEQDGMKLRDYFAAAALQGMLAGDPEIGFKKLAMASYEAADEMLRARVTA